VVVNSLRQRCPIAVVSHDHALYEAVKNRPRLAHNVELPLFASVETPKTWVYGEVLLMSAEAYAVYTFVRDHTLGVRVYGDVFRGEFIKHMRVGRLAP
jgi:hypothetical protein